ncbi:choice-of-anchor Q domain-containing protein [Agromyces sp. Soil535]|uniref:choice-of-anchor Q domain-containing protein n=1 Tax=Agromyces sp. Soil535 TaxID=1736390 RepID=UPI0006F88E4E|nr:choice-of-anchor Q domain-containing protein [Agromyces sp. Soil535]KRE23095.1 hypothetical protein ASG80_09625 [Agromyces sp. Soil535]
MHPATPPLSMLTVTIALAGLAGGLLFAVTGPSGPAHADSVIVVDSTSQALGEPGCTLPEAILAANHDASVVPDPIGNGGFIDTQCAAGSGIDVIELAPVTYAFSEIIDDASNHLGPTATPLVTSALIIEGRGAVIQRTGTANFRAFAVGPTGDLDLREVHVKGFAARGGNGGNRGGGGGLGAGGAIAVHEGALLVQWSTFEANSATGGDGGDRSDIGGAGGGGGGGLGGWGSSDGGGGGGARGHGASGGGIGNNGGGGGGTVFDAGPTQFREAPGGYRCGGDGAVLSIADEFLVRADGDDAGCAGGGGGGGANGTFGSGDGGAGGYGGGGGGGAWDDGDGGPGGFGGGGGGAAADLIDGCGYCGGSGGGGGFGAGGGGAPGGFVFGGPGDGGTFGGDGSELYGGGGAGLGGAIFGHSATITVSNSTFTHNFAVRGVAGEGGFDDDGAQNGADAGGAIFTVGGTLAVTNSTIAGNESTGDGAGVVVYKPTTGEATSLVLHNAIIAGNTGRDECFVLGGVATSGSNNLVTPHATDARTPCPAITQTADPELGALALNAPGRTPTMAIGALSPAVNTGNLAFAPLDDQRGIARPQFGSADIGAYEFEGGADVTAPRAAPAITSGSGLDGWSTTDVTVNWGWNDGVGSAGIDPELCTLESTSTGEGSAILLTATCTDLAGNVSTAEFTVKVDKTAPTVTCDPAPTYVVGGTPTTGLSATVTDALSGPASSPVTAEVVATDLAEPGVFEKSLTGSDVAGNTMTVACQYVVAYDFLGFLQPVPQSSYKRGSTIPVRFQIGDASGQPISDTAAAALVSPTCLVFVTLDGQTKGCATYNAVSNTFQFDVKTSKALASGDHTVGILVRTVDGDIVNTDSTTVRLR